MIDESDFNESSGGEEIFSLMDEERGSMISRSLLLELEFTPVKIFVLGVITESAKGKMSWSNSAIF